MNKPTTSPMQGSFEVDPSTLDSTEPELNMKGSFTIDPQECASSLSNAEENVTSDITSACLEEEFEEEPESASFWGSPVLWFMLLLLAFGALQTYNLINEAFNSSLIAGFLWSLGLGIAFIMALLSIYREFSSVLRLKSADKHRLEYKEIIANGNYAQALALCKKMAEAAKITQTREWQGFLNKTQSHFDVQSVFALYETTVLRAQDERAHRLIVRRSTENGVIVALSPVAWLDMFLTLARSLRLIRELSVIYGLQCGVWGRVQLYRRVAHNLVFIGIADLASDAVVEVFGASAATKLSAALGQGVAAGVYSTRLGFMAVKAVRPLPLSAKIMSLGSLRKELLTGGVLAKLLKSKS